MSTGALPYYLEDRSGSYAGSDFDDIYDRLFLRVALMIYNVGRRSSNQRDYRPLQREPSVALEFGPSGTLDRSLSWARLRSHCLEGESLIRKFRASNGEEYKWTYKTESDHQWSCTDSANYVVAHYNLKPPNKPAFRTSGNMLTINETHASLAIELLASLTIMRHVAAYHL
ncbi:uncharacterized protein B0H18DRAFT_999460 [Fomitopsis serialis]|uniref:uncharacterized protein n=1 Tax=Fomitopsis serialis TaxID=139415 RepID=UPI0020089386|nr:uncharacterized protein B0H18DRAFT_999460 [Neoantrodia serialis]KAH9928934.1 hypothetical protein B0H18DRAFT_999460 [Neoantrodia serialis]